MNYRDLQNISNLSQEILIEGANEEHNVLNRWPYTSPYLQESTELDERYERFPYKKVEDKIHKKESDNPTGRGTPQSVKMGTVFRHFKGGKEVRRSEKREHSPQISKAKEKENRARGTQKEQVDIYDIILSHLLDEGYAETQEQAEVIMVNMSEDWRESIVEQASTVASSGGAGGKVTADKQYPATLRGLKGVKSTDSKGTEYFQPYTSSGRREPSGKPFEPTTMPDANRAQYKQSYSGKYENIPASQSTKNPQSHLFRTGVPRVRSATSTYGID